MRIPLLLLGLLAATAWADEEIVTGDYVIPPSSQLLGAVPGERKVLLSGTTLYNSSGNNFYPSSNIPVDLTQATAGVQLSALRVRFTSGQEPGFPFTVSALSATSMTVDDSGPGWPLFSPTNSAGEAYELVQAWTINDLFPTTWPNGTQLLFCDNLNSANPSADKIYTLGNGIWYKTLGVPSGPAGSDVVKPNAGFYIRNVSTSISIHWLFAGYTRNSPVRGYLEKTVASGNNQDFWVGDDTGIARSIQNSSFGVALGVKALGFPVPSTFTSSASHVSIYSSSNTWLHFSGTSGVYQIAPGEGFILRVLSTDAAGTLYVFTP